MIRDSKAARSDTRRYGLSAGQVAEKAKEVRSGRLGALRELAAEMAPEVKAQRERLIAEFELAMGKMAENGQALTADALCQKYHELNKLYFGPDMVSDDQIALEWARIPHFFYNYYVFQYATGFSAAVAIANRILKEGAPAVADYKKFLSGGCSTDPISLLKIAGVDMSSPEPVNSALALFGELVDEMEQLV